MLVLTEFFQWDGRWTNPLRYEMVLPDGSSMMERLLSSLPSSSKERNNFGSARSEGRNVPISRLLRVRDDDGVNTDLNPLDSTLTLSIGTASVSGAAIEEELIVISSKTITIAVILCVSVGALAWWFNGSMGCF